jgi:VWFA-related protein
MRRNLTTLAVLGIFSLPALAVKTVTLEQLQQTLQAAQTAHQSDDATAQQLSDFRLSARLVGNTLQHGIAVSPGPKTTQALHIIADASAFLDPPSDQTQNKPAPGGTEQSAIFAQTLHYAVHVVPTLPNFVATRVTEHYVDSMRGLESQESQQRGGLFLLGIHSAPISYRDGRETDDPSLRTTSAHPDKKKHPGQPGNADPIGGLTSWGEFGPILKVVLGDSIKGKLTWARWQLEDSKPVAVFRFEVDRSTSHYGLSYCCETSTESTAGAFVQTKHPVTLRQIGYHGFLEVDPEAGTILRITIEADLHPEDLILQASMMIEYAPVKIADATYYCPTHSVSSSVSLTQIESHGELHPARRMLLNDVEFVDYHRFGSESTLITQVPPVSNPENQNPQPSPSEQSARSATPAQSEPATAHAVNQQPPAKSDSALSTSNPPPAVSAVASTPPSTPNEPAAQAGQEVVIQALNSPPGFSENTAKIANSGGQTGGSGNFTIQSTTRSVNVSLIADDKHGKPIADLKQTEVNVFDNARQQQLRQFYRVTPGDSAAPASVPTQARDTFTNTASTNAQLQNMPDLLILLLDESHLAYHDLNQARTQVANFLKSTSPSSRIALYAISERGFRVIQDVTQDHAQVQKKLAAWVPDASAVAQAQALERRDRQQFDTVHSAKDLDSVNGNNVDEPETDKPLDPELSQMGDNPLRYALEGMVALARHFAPVPGHKSIAWISGDTVLFDWDGAGKEKGGKQLDAALLHTREALNEARISLYVLDASAIEGGAIDASIQNRNVEVNPVDQNGPAPRNNTAGRTTAQMQQDTHSIQTPVRQLAESTGGRAFNKGSDLKAVLDGIDRDSSSYYELAFDPDTPADGKFHTLQVKVPTRKDVVLSYRSGYLYAESSATPQQRLQQAVWSPQDASAIGLTAEPVLAADSASGSPTLKLRIAFPGLALEKQSDRWTDQLYIFLAQRDDATQKVEVSGDTLRLSLKQASYESGMPTGIPYQRAVDIKSKLGSVRVIVVDGNSGKMGSVTLPSSALHPSLNTGVK